MLWKLHQKPPAMQVRNSRGLFGRPNTSTKTARTAAKGLQYSALEPRQLLATGAELLSNAHSEFVTVAPQPLTSSTTTATGSGNWNDVTVWSNGLPSDTSRAVIPAGNTVVLNGTDHFAKELVVQGVLIATEAPGVDKSLTSDWIHVNSGGLFQIGSATNRYDTNDFVINLVGTDPTETFNIEGVPSPITNNNGFLMVAGGGRLQFFGQQKLTYTRLAATANANSSQIIVANAVDRDYDGDTDADDGTVNWEVGDQIVIASSSADYDDQEVRTITAIVDLGNGTSGITLNQSLNHRHYGQVETYNNATRTWELDLRAEVALLNRNVRIEGLASQDTDNSFGDRARFNAGIADGFGGHIMIMATAGQVTVDSVQLDRMGQTGRLGRYPIHWHLAGDRSGDILRGVSITNSNNRGVTIHGTDNVLIQDVVLHDIHGHGFFMEDGVETGNEYLGNIAFGIHQVGRTTANSPQPNPNDPFVVDTHDHVGQNNSRFLSSAAYWITNPDNTWVGNISAGSQGTGFWFILPDRAIGDSAANPLYNNVRPDRTNLRQFDFNSSHSSPAGLNFDRGSDLEVPVGATLKANFAGDNWLPTEEPQINNFTAYKHNVAIYHRGFDANFHDNRIADSNIGTFITFTQRITDTLYVGHSRGNADTSDFVTGHTIYDGANTLDGTHFAGFAAGNAHTFRTNGSALRHTSHVMTNTSFENDGSGNHVSVGTQGGSPSQTSPFDLSAASIYDADGTLTGHVGGGPGSTVVTNHPFFYDNDDFIPAGWNAAVTDDIYAMLHFDPNNDGSRFRVTSPDGDRITDEGNSRRNTHIKASDSLDPSNDYRIDLVGGSLNNGFDFRYWTRTGPTDSTVLRFVGFGNTLRPQNMSRATTLNELRAATETTYTVVNGDVYVKAFTSSSDINMENFSSTDPTSVNDFGFTDAGTPVNIAVLSNDSDNDGDSLTVTAGSSVPTGPTVLVADYTDDFQSGTPAAGWQYLWNPNGAFGNANDYSVMPADGSVYRPPSEEFLNLASGSGHPGPGVDNSTGGPFDRLPIAAYTVPVDGQYSIDDSFLSRDGAFGDGVSVLMHVGNSVTQIGSFEAESTGDFDTSIGFLTAGTTIYIGVTPDGPGSGSSAGNDYFTWDFSIVRQATSGTNQGNGQVTVNPDQSITYTPNPGFVGTDTFSYVVSDSRGGSDTANVTVTVDGVASPNVVGQYIFYKDSAFDTGNHRAAIATDKTAALPGETTQYGNFSNYDRGLNGILIDVVGFSATPTINDFELRVGNDDTPAAWPALTATTGIEFLPDAGADGSDQIALTWADNAIQNQWLQVTVKANSNSNLATDQVFYFGNQIGDTDGDTDIHNRVRVNSFDTIRTRLNNASASFAPIDTVYDIDRNGRVNSLDTFHVFSNQEISGLQMLTTPESPPPVPVIAAPIIVEPIFLEPMVAEQMVEKPAGTITTPTIAKPAIAPPIVSADPSKIDRLSSQQQDILTASPIISVAPVDSAVSMTSDGSATDESVDTADTAAAPQTKFNFASFWPSDAYRALEPFLTDPRSENLLSQTIGTFTPALAGAIQSNPSLQASHDGWFSDYQIESDLDEDAFELDDLIQRDTVSSTT
jgi:hypothetical protein